ncbi:MAG: hypothetical protein ACE5K4_08235 [Candidatus Hydrothermarchaeota archaeon]
MIISFASLIVATLIVTTIHAIMPTHWLPFVLVGRAQKWSYLKTISITVFAGLGHVSVTTVLGLIVAGIGIEISKVAARLVELLGGIMLFLLGIAYIHIFFRKDSQPERVDLSNRAAIMSLFTILTFSPCEAVIPIFFAASSFGWKIIVPLAIILAIGTVGGMAIMVATASIGLKKFEHPYLERYEKLIMGIVLAFLGIIIIILR